MDHLTFYNILNSFSQDKIELKEYFKPPFGAEGIKQLLEYAINFKKQSKEVNVLYCGMADDIVSALILCPNLTTLYVIDKFDPAFSRTNDFMGIQQDIAITLVEGNDIKSYDRELMIKTNKHYPINNLRSRSTLLRSRDYKDYWELYFLYDGSARRLVYFHHRDFLKKWPKEIKNISHLMSMGATFDLGSKKLSKRIVSRCNNEVVYYDNIRPKTENLMYRFVRGRHVFIQNNFYSKIINNYKSKLNDEFII